MKRMISISILIHLFPLFIAAEPLVLTLDDAVEMAISENLTLKKSDITLLKKERAKRTSWNSLLPSITASASLTAKHGIFSFQGESAASFSDPGKLGFSAGLTLTLPLNVAIATGVQQLKASYEAGLLDHEAAVNSLKRDVQKQFYNILANQENIMIQQANIDLAQKRYEQASENFKTGLVPELDVLSAEVSLSKLKPALTSAQQTYNSMVLQFKTIIGADRNDDITLQGELPNEYYGTLNAEELIEKYLANRLDIRSLDKQLEALGLTKATLALNSNTPTLSIGYTYGLNGSNATTNIQQQAIEPWTNWNDMGTLSLGLQWKLDGLIPNSKTNVQIKDLEDNIKDLVLTREIAWRGAGTEVENLVGSIQTYRLTIEANTSSTKLARKNYELTAEAYNVGTRQLLDVESAQNDYLLAQQQLLIAKYQYIATILDLEFALNISKEEFLP